MIIIVNKYLIIYLEFILYICIIIEFLFNVKAKVRVKVWVKVKAKLKLGMIIPKDIIEIYQPILIKII